METLIIYTGKYGCTKECAEQLKKKLDNGATIVNVANEVIPSLDEYDNIIIGSSVYIGQINKKIKAFANDNVNMLLKKKIGLFLVCGFTEKFNEVLAQNFQKELIEHASSTECFGGEINVDKMNFLHKGVVKMLEKEMDVSKINLMPENINKMANEMR